MKRFVDFSFIVAVISVVFVRPAHAYLDPGTASLILQGIIGSIAAAGFVFRSYLYKLVSIFRDRSAIENATDMDNTKTVTTIHDR